MNATNGSTRGGPGRGHPRWPAPWRAGVLAAGMAAIAVLAAACGGGSAGSAGAAGRSDLQIALGYANCMRSHGAPDWPDPNSQDNALVLWELRGDALARGLFLDGLAQATGLASRLLLTAV